MAATEHHDVIVSRAGRAWLGSVFGTVPVDPTRRAAGDVGRLVLAGFGIWLCLRTSPELSTLDDVGLTVASEIGDLADGLLVGLYWLGVIVPGLAVVVASLVTRRRRLLLAALGSVAVALAGGFALGTAVDLPSATTITGAGLTWEGGEPTLPVLAVALAAAVVFGALPFLMRPTRFIALGALLVAVACGALSGEALTSVVLASTLLGWGAAALVHLALGAPEGGPGIADVTIALAEIGVPVTSLVAAPDDEPTHRQFRATSADGEELSVVVVGRDATRYRTSRALVRRLWYKESGPAVGTTRLAMVERRALLMLLAERNGVAVPRLVAIGTAGPNDDALGVTLTPTGTPLDELPGELVTDGVLDDLWGNVKRLHRAGIVHGDLRAHDIVVDADGATVLVGFGSAAPAGRGARIDIDDAALLVTTASVAGADRALAAYQRVCGADALASLLPVLEAAALPPGVRRSTGGARKAMKRLREEAADMLGVEPPALEELRRVAPASLAMAVGGLLGVYLVAGELSDAGGMRSILAGAEPWWVLVVALVSQTPQLAQAVAMLGSVVQQIPLGSATAVQFANQFMGLVGGTVATTALVIRYFQRLGLGAAVAISSGVLNTVATMVTQVVLVAAGLWLSRGDWQRTGVLSGGTGSSSGSDIMSIVVIVAFLVAVVLVLPRLRHRVGTMLRPHVKVATDNLREVRHQPGKALQLFGGNAASQILFAMTLGAALLAYGESLPLMQLVVINSFASLLGGILPVPGGLGVIEAGLIAGFVAAGIPQDQATAATFTARLFTAYLPPLWGWVSLRWLRGHDYV
ncbi:MAG: flippase-like domain-containing protein [Acidimicrobiales bacterium]|jgi:uncharacterized membrane protein YbhN (UPF0104 family)|nr:flippase-like domain-containing protein [Acidimicrobiales bacterium]